MKGISFFDVDGTLINGYSGYFATLELIRSGRMKKRRVLQALFYKLLNPLFPVNVRKVYEIAAKDLAGLTLNQVLEIGKKVFEKDIKHRLYQEGLERIQKDRKEGNSIILLSAGPLMVIQILKEYLQADEFFSISPKIIDNILQNKLQDPLCHGEGKLTIALQEAKKANLSLEDCSFYSDSIEDLPLLEKVGKAYVVNPDGELRKKAIQKGWAILQFKKEATNI